jgi:peptide/nickel transport system substrate-binding protein
VRRRKTTITVLAGLATVALTLSACGNPDKHGNGGTGTTADGMIANLNGGGFGGGDNPQKNYNPYLPAGLTPTYFNETLFLVNGYSCEPTPWLATEGTWTDNKTFTVTTRQGVKFSDGQPFSAKDVEFTFNMIKKYAAFDNIGVWDTGLDSVTATDDHTVVFTFKAPVSDGQYKLSQVKIVPEHIWSKQADPSRYTAPDAVGTGPMTVKSFNGRQLVLQRNPNYWQADKVKVQQLTFTNNSGGGDADKLRMARGEYDWNAMFITDIDKTYVSKDKDFNKYWFPPGGIISLYMNLTKAPFNDAGFRKALTGAIDRQEISDKAEFGYVQPASQTGLILPNAKDWLAPQYQADNGVIKYDAEAAKAAFRSAGYSYDGSGKLLGKDGKPMKLAFKVQAGFLDWIAASNVVKDNLGKVGIDLEVRTQAPPDVDNDRNIGNYDMTFGVPGGSCSNFQNFDDPLGTDRTAPIGKEAKSNTIRWSDPTTDSLLSQLHSTVDEAGQKPIVYKLQDIMMQQVPHIPLWYGPNWFEYRTKNAVGWPSADDPYAYPNNDLLILTHLTPPAK